MEFRGLQWRLGGARQPPEEAHCCLGGAGASGRIHRAATQVGSCLDISRVEEEERPCSSCPSLAP